MNVCRFRIGDLLILVALAALGSLLFRDASPYEQSDLTFIVAPLTSSLVMCGLVGTAIAATVGRRDRVARRWGFLLGCGSYVVLSWNLGFDASWAPVASSLARDGLGLAGTKAGEMGWTSAQDLAKFLGFTSGNMLFRG